LATCHGADYAEGMRSALALALLCLPACGDSYVIAEADGVAIARTEFAARGVTTDAARSLGPLTIDAAEVSFTLDGWSAARSVGFEYVSEEDPDFVEAATDLGALDETAKLQTAVDAALAGEPQSHVLVIRTWGHETAELATSQLRRYVDEWLTAQGL